MDEKRRQRQNELAKIFYEMGMDDELVSKIAGLNPQELSKIKEKKVDKKIEKVYNDEVK